MCLERSEDSIFREDRNSQKVHVAQLSEWLWAALIDEGTPRNYGDPSEASRSVCNLSHRLGDGFYPRVG
jgi:hypothetical protein